MSIKELLTFELFLRERETVHWKTKSGTEILIKDLTTPHLKNILRCMEDAEYWKEQEEVSQAEFLDAAESYYSNFDY